ncbi:hypothetical protein [Sulfurospirillum deleyianum]|uniref:Uncharacterized protein n=1 Tax=Sulfurospirillum deleyianum (strain ATCC 51133 / DSM 6946 / 5175) TaxID=525898 RepID=D1B1Y2_SULD5|nr:hypothetical protein [Sulfurospirillum deleyianum]ACZ12102.1 conserved hypothetical protein [Sulfurospirillum deleyianum DSM 6946]
MNTSYEEKTFENYFNAELGNLSSVYFPLGQTQEGVIGADSVAYSKNRHLWKMFGYPWFWFQPPYRGRDLQDIAQEMEHHTKASIQNIPKIKTNLLFQYKRSKYLILPSSGQWRHWNQPYFRYEIYPKQQKLLEHLESQFGQQALVLYAAPAIKNVEELVEASIKKQIIEKTNFQKVSNLSGHHKNTFVQAGTISKAFSQLEEIENVDLLKTLNNIDGQDFSFDKLTSFTSIVNEVMIESNEYNHSFNLLMEQYSNLQEYRIFYGLMQMKVFKELTGIQWSMSFEY